MAAPQLIIIGQMIHYIDENGCSHPAFVYRIHGKGLIDAFALMDAGMMRIDAVGYDKTGARESWHTSLCSVCKRMAV